MVNQIIVTLMPRYVILLLLLVAPLLFFRCGNDEPMEEVPSNARDAMRALSVALDNHDDRCARRTQYIDSLKTELMYAELGDSLTLLEEIVKGYRHFQLDSFVYYSDEAIRVADSMGKSDMAVALGLRKIESYPLLLRFDEALNDFDEFDPISLSDANRRLYYEVGRRMYLYFTTVHSAGALYDGYIGKFAEYNDSLLAILSPSDPYYKESLGYKYICDDEILLSIAVLSEQLSDMSIADERYSDVASMLGLSYYLRGREEMWRYATSLAAISEIRLAMRDGETMRRLASGYYKVGHHGFAYRLMVESDKDVAASGAIMRSVHISEDIPVISEAYLSAQKASRFRLIAIMICLVAISCLAAIMLGNKLRDKKKLDEMAMALKQANKSKDMYISQFLSLCATYVDKIEDFNRLVSRKLAAGQIEELFELAKTEKVIDEQRILFYDIFDRAFMRIYPNFIKEVNMLLQDDKQFSESDGVHLTPELRILAFMRLGLESGSQMSRFLGLSVNTVYAYRNRIKSRAKNRDSFEWDISQIGIREVDIPS